MAIIIDKMYRAVLLLFFLISLNGQTCLKSTGEGVEWWVILKVPPKIGKVGYGYYDSKMRTGKFIYYDSKVDAGATALTKTLELINNNNLEHVAWNDEKPSGETSSTYAHSKGLIAYSLQAAKGFLISHSIPKYPMFSGGKVNPVIAASENVYGQDIACFSMNVKELDDLVNRLLITWPFVYEAKISNTAATTNLYKLGQSSFTSSSSLFDKHDIRTVYSYNIKSIFKNDKINGSIFEDGLTTYLGVGQLIAQTWGRPLQKSWCAKSFQVLNAVNINVGGVTWTEQDDHSKWVLAVNNYACFGDMNRMSSQWKRGGAFYCLNDATLVAAIHGVIISHDSC